MALISFSALGFLLSLICFLFVFWCLVIERSIMLTRETINLNLGDILRSTKCTAMTFIKNLIDSNKEKIDIELVLEMFLSFILFALMTLLIPFDNESFFSTYPALSENYSILVKVVLTMTLLNSFNFKNNLIDRDIYYDLKRNLNRLIVVLFNLYVLGRLDPLHTGLISKYYGVFISFILIDIFFFTDKNTSKTNMVGKGFIVLKSKQVLCEVTWMLFILGHFFNFSSLIKDKLILIGFSIILICCLLWIKRVIGPITVRVIDIVTEEKIIKISMIVSLINFIGIEIYAFF